MQGSEKSDKTARRNKHALVGRGSELMEESRVRHKRTVIVKVEVIGREGRHRCVGCSRLQYGVE